MFVRAYTLMNEEKHLAIFEVDIDGTRFLCNNASHETSRHGPSKQYKDIAEVVLDRMRQVAANLKLESSLNKENAHKVRWSAALLRALCYVNKYCGAGRPGHGGGQEPRILCIVASPDDSSEYLAMMNGIFAAQRREIVIDACVLNNSHSSFMQQACFLTKGIYLHPRHPQALLQYLMVGF